MGNGCYLSVSIQQLVPNPLGRNACPILSACLHHTADCLYARGSALRGRHCICCCLQLWACTHRCRRCIRVNRLILAQVILDTLMYAPMTMWGTLNLDTAVICFSMDALEGRKKKAKVAGTFGKKPHLSVFHCPINPLQTTQNFLLKLTRVFFLDVGTLLSYTNPPSSFLLLKAASGKKKIKAI